MIYIIIIRYIENYNSPNYIYNDCVAECVPLQKFI